ncbi:MAG: efflux RND transporter periplasmic adaptor subunit [Vicinamibacterales bacterium]
MMVRRGSTLLLVLVIGAAAAACGGTEEVAGAAGPYTLQLAPEQTATVAEADLTSGPTISGQLTPAREATVRSQVGGSIVSLGVDRGEAVRKDEVVARISSRDLEQALASSETAVRSAETALEVARSEQQRTEALVTGGALAARDLEQARNAVANAEAALAAARSRETSVRQQIDDTAVRAPFAGVVSDRPASPGDVVTPGTPIVTVIDPSSLRLEALVPSDAIGQARPGSTVRFTIRGYPGQAFAGRIDRVAPTADPVTRQVAIFVTLPNVNGRLIAGLFAEGRVEAERHRGLVIPLSALDETGPVPVVTRVHDGKAERVTVTTGLREADSERVEITGGLTAGDVVVTGSAKRVAPGTPVSIVSGGPAGTGD